MLDAHNFLKDVSNWNNHRPLLLKALQATTGPVLELGMGEGSTQYLHDYCAAQGRSLESYDNNFEWTSQFGTLADGKHRLFCVGDNFESKRLFEKKWSVVLVDNAPGESRWKLIEALKDYAEIIIVHDSEPEATGYMLNKIWGLFEYKVDTPNLGDDKAWATAMSNTIDVRKWAGEEHGGYKFQKFRTMANKTVILSSNDNLDYLKYYPYVSWAWNQLGWDTLLFYLGKHTPLLEEYKAVKDHFDDERNKIITLSNIEGYRPETIVQVSRLFGGMVFTDERILMTGDVDMIPLSDYWKPEDHQITCYGHDLTGHTQIPICYIAMAASKWRDIMGCPNNTTLDHEIKFMLDRSPNARSDDFEKWWSYDQQYITEKINQQPTVMHVIRGKDGILAQGRADRYDWEGTKHKGTIDAHMPRPFNLEAVKYILEKNFGKLPAW